MSDISNDIITPNGQGSHTLHSHGDNCVSGDIAHHMAIAAQACAARGERFTKLRAHIFELILTADGAVKAYDLLEQISPDVGSPKPPTIYRALDFLSRLGLIHRVEALNAYIACDHAHDGEAAEFFICTNCQAVQERHAHDHTDCMPDGFLIKRSVIEHYGLCATCQTLNG